MGNKRGYLACDSEGYWYLYEQSDSGFAPVAGFKPTNALLPAIARAQNMGYEGEDW